MSSFKMHLHFHFSVYFSLIHSIPLGVKFSQSIGNLKMNLSKNHSHTSLPYDHNRVKLNRLNDSSQTDYINASFIDGYMRRRAYIAAQSPFDMLTIQDFWLMIFQCNIAQIVMLTNSIEDSTLKCCQYWPEVSEKEVLLNFILVLYL